MKIEELRVQQQRLERYQKLAAIRQEIQTALDIIKEPWTETGPDGQGPFTGNTRESRKVLSVKIQFSATLGGACPVSIEIPAMPISAWDLGRALEGLLRAKLAEYDVAMGEI